MLHQTSYTSTYKYSAHKFYYILAHDPSSINNNGVLYESRTNDTINKYDEQYVVTLPPSPQTIHNISQCIKQYPVINIDHINQLQSGMHQHILPQIQSNGQLICTDIFHQSNVHNIKSDIIRSDNIQSNNKRQRKQ